MSEADDAQSFEDLELSDNEYISQKRLESILKWYDRVLEREDEIETARVQGRVSNAQADILYKTAVNQYVQDAVKTLKGKGFAEFLYSKTGNYGLGSVEIAAPTPYAIAWQKARPNSRIGPDPPSNPTTMPPGYNVAHETELTDETLHVVGLLGFTNAPPEFERAFTVKLNGPGGRTSDSLTVTQPMPREISRHAFRTTNTLLNRLDIDVDLDAYNHGKT